MQRKKSDEAVSNIAQKQIKPQPTPALYSEIRKKLMTFHLKGEKQERLWDAIDKFDLVIAVGSAGSGKTMVSIAKALDLLTDKGSKFEKITLLTPIIEAGEEKLGFLPGDVNDKIMNYHESMISVFYDLIGENLTKKLVEMGVIVPQVIAFVRGATFKKSIIIVDETQNITKTGGKLLLTRIGNDSKLVFNGDDKQIDIKDKRNSALIDFQTRFEKFSKMKFIKFTKQDIVRNPLITEILNYYEDEV